jgi:YD repeat-containing protein
MSPSMHTLDALDVSFDDGHLVAGAGLLLPANSGGLLTGLALPLSRTVVYHYDASNRLDKVTDVRSNFTLYGYDAANRLNAITDQNNNLVTQNVYGADGRMTSQTLLASVPLGLGAGLWWFLSSNDLPSGGPQAIVLGIVALACFRKAIKGPPK